MSALRVRSSLRALTAVLLGLACARAESPRGGATIDTLANGTVIVRNPAEGGWDSSAAWGVTELTRVGGEHADTASAFGMIEGVATDRAGRLLVGDRQAYAISVFDTSGRLVRRIGRRGQGPGEFSQIMGLRIDAEGRLWVADGSNDRYTVFDSAGSVLKTYRRTVGGSSAEWQGWFDNRGRLLEPSRVSGRPSTFVRHVVDSASLIARDSFPLPAVTQQYYTIRFEAGASMNMPVPFAPSTTWRFDGREGFWVGISDRYRLVHLSFAGDTLRIIERAIEALPINPAERSAAEERLAVRAHPRFGAAVSPPLDPSLIPATKPFFSTFFLDDTGHIWVARMPASPEDARTGTQFDILDPSGVFLGSLRLGILPVPAPVIQESRIAGVARDSLGTQSAVLYRLQRR